MTSIPLLTNAATQGPQFTTIQQVNPMAVLWNALGSASAITITGGLIDGTVIGSVTPSSATFTNITSAGTVDLHLATVIFSSGQISGNSIAGGTINNVNVVLNSNPTTNLQAATKQYVDSAVGSASGLIWQNLAVSGQSTLTAGSSTDTLHIASGSNIAITTNTSTKTLTIGFTGTLPTGSLPTFTGDVTNSGLALTIGANVVTNAKSAQMAGHTYKGNNTGSLANPADITSTQLTADLNVFTTSLNGLVPAPVSVNGYFLNDSGTFSAPTATTPIASFTNSIADSTFITPTQVAWTVAPIPSTLINTISGASIASNTITLPTGTYWFSGSIMLYNPSVTYGYGASLQLYDSSNSTTVLADSMQMYLEMTDTLWIEGPVIVSGNTNFQLKYFTNTGAGGGKIGTGNSHGINVNVINATFKKIG